MKNQSNEHNESIGCTVTECTYHCKSDDYCTLDHIEVIKHDANAQNVESTDCGSFEKK